MSIKTIENMMTWVEANIKDDPTLDLMSDYVGYSSFYCSMKFHEAVGITFKEYVLRRKLTLAAIDLRVSNHRIIDVALGYGFSSNEAFSRAFQKKYGSSPREFRKGFSEIPLVDKEFIPSGTPQYINRSL